MRGETDRAKLERFITALGERVRGPGTVYLTGGAMAVWYGWRTTTIDVDLKADPEPAGFFEAIAAIKDELDVNVELASPDQFIPPLPDWKNRSIFVRQHGDVAFYLYDPYAQALAKLQRRHERDLRDVRAMRELGLIRIDRLRELLEQIVPDLLRYPAIDAATFRASVAAFCDDAEHAE